MKRSSLVVAPALLALLAAGSLAVGSGETPPRVLLDDEEGRGVRRKRARRHRRERPNSGAGKNYDSRFDADPFARIQKKFGRTASGKSKSAKSAKSVEAAKSKSAKGAKVSRSEGSKGSKSKSKSGPRRWGGGRWTRRSHPRLPNEDDEPTLSPTLTPPPQFKIVAADGAAGDGFGLQVAVHDDVVVVGAPDGGGDGMDSRRLQGGGGRGAAYVFARDAAGDGWSQRQRLAADDGAPGDRFGRAVGIFDGTVVVSAPGDEGNGASYVFMREGVFGNWTQQDIIVAADGASAFGESVDIHDGTVIVGAQTADGREAALLFTEDEDAGGNWTQEAEVVIDDTTDTPSYAPSYFEGTSADFPTPVPSMVPVPSETLKPTQSQPPTPIQGVRSLRATLARATSVAEDRLISQDFTGGGVGIFGDIAIVGVAEDGENDGGNEAYLFARERSNLRDGSVDWRREATLVADDGAAGDRFGWSVGIHDGTAVVGAPGDDDVRGSAYIFTRQANGGWAQIEKLLAMDGEAGDEFGTTVSIFDNTVIVGAPGDDGGKGSVYVFEAERDEWVEKYQLGAEDGVAGDLFGRSGIDVHNNTVVIGAAGRGAAYIIDLS